MATRTLGTNAATTLTAVPFNPSQAVLLPADMATIAQGIRDDGAPLLSAPAATKIVPGAFSYNGLLFIPNRGVLKVMPGDWVAIDASGWPILLSAHAISYASTSWSHS